MAVLCRSGFLFPAGAVWAGERSTDYIGNFYQIPATALGEVFTLDTDKLVRNLSIAGIGVLLYTQDESIRDFFQDDVVGANRHWDRAVARHLQDISSPTGFLLFHGATSLTAYLTEDAYLMETSLLSLQAVLLSVTAAEVSRSVSGRSRPSSEPKANDWSGSGRSFFSARTAAATASMTIYAERYRAYPAAYWGAYGLAGLIALSDLHENAHWASDVFVGAVAGYGLAQLTLRLNPFDAGGSTYILPLIVDEYIGLSFFHAF